MEGLFGSEGSGESMKRFLSGLAWIALGLVLCAVPALIPIFNHLRFGFVVLAGITFVVAFRTWQGRIG